MSRAIIVVGKVPEAGKVKTRLIPKLGAELATDVYIAMLVDVLRFVRLVAQNGARAVFAFDGDPVVAERLAPGFELVRQSAGDLGARLGKILEDVAADQAVLIGADAPSLSMARIESALDGLDEDDAVMIPAVDGGYVLLGVNGVPTALFEDIPWSTDRVAAATEAAAARAQIRLKVVLPAVRDLDLPEDLLPMLESLEPDTRTARAIRAALGITEC